MFNSPNPVDELLAMLISAVPDDAVRVMLLLTRMPLAAVRFMNREPVRFMSLLPVVATVMPVPDVSAMLVPDVIATFAVVDPRLSVRAPVMVVSLLPLLVRDTPCVAVTEKLPDGAMVVSPTDVNDNRLVDAIVMELDANVDC